MRDAERSAGGLHPPASMSLSVSPRQVTERLEPAHQLLLALLQQISSSGAQAGALQGPDAAAKVAAPVAAGTAGSAFAAAATPLASPGSMAPPPPRIRRADSAPAAASQRKRGRAEAGLDAEGASQPAVGQREAFSAPASPSQQGAGQQGASPLLFRELWKQMELPPEVVRTLSAPPPRLDPVLLQQPLERQRQLQAAEASQKTAKEALALSLAFEAYRRLYEHKRAYGATPLPLPNNVVKLLARSILGRRQ